MGTRQKLDSLPSFQPFISFLNVTSTIMSNEHSIIQFLMQSMFTLVNNAWHSACWIPAFVEHKHN